MTGRLAISVSALKPRYDAVVVGSGYGGGVAACRMARMGLAVAVLERGRERVPGEFPTTVLQANRDLQIHGLALSMILGVSMRVLPGLFGTPAVNERRAVRLFGPLQAMIVLEVALFPVAMTSRRPALFVAVWLAWVGLAVCAALAVSSLRAFARPRFVVPRFSPLAFVRAAHVWLGASLAMLAAGPFWSRLVGLPFSHAWHGATRHAITVGFVSLMIVGVASRVAPRPPGTSADAEAMPLAPFLLLNLGCTLRVTQQVLTDLPPVAFPTAGVSGLLEVSGLVWWATWIVPRLLAASRPQGGRVGVAPGTARV